MAVLHLLFQLGPEQYAVPAGQVVEALPLVPARPLPRALPGITGLLLYRGETVPMLDLVQCTLHRPCRPHLSSRLLLLRYPQDGGTRLLALAVEKATETLLLRPEEWQETGVEVAETPFLGPVARTSRGLVQRLQVERLLPEEVRAALFADSLSPAPCP